MDSSFVSFTLTDFSSENPENPAKNLSDKSKKQHTWTAGAAGSSQEFVVLQLVKPVTVHSIKVTNNFSGLLEVLGCKFETKSEATSNGSSSVTPWETIVSKSSLMTPLDSRGKKNGNLERDLSLKPETLNFLWDKLKFVCQQPFNKELPYGLSAIEIQGSSSASNGGSRSDIKAGGFVLKKKDKTESIRVGSLFGSSVSGKIPASGVTSKEESPVTSSDETPPPPDVPAVKRTTLAKSDSPGTDRVAAANRPIKLRNGGTSREGDGHADKKPSTSLKRPTRDSSESASEKDEPKKQTRGRPTKKNARRDSTSDDEKETKASNSAKSPRKGKNVKPEKGSDSEEEEEEEEPVKSRGRPKKQLPKGSDHKESADKKRISKGKDKSVKPKKKEEEESEEDAPSVSKKSNSNRKSGKNDILRHVMDGCVLALSGFVNPLRSELREKALEMGAKYKPDWSAECTHLVCAFPKTPKFNQVRAAGGRIVKKEWIFDCYKNRRMPPWRTYMLKPDMASQNVDDEDELEDAKFNEDEEWEPDASASSAEEEEDDEQSDAEVLSEEFSDSEKSLDDDEEIAVTDEEMDESELPLTPPPSVKKAKAKKPAKRRRGVRFDESDSEDEEELNLTDSEEPDIPEKDFTPRKRPLFRNMNFFLYGDFSDEEKTKLGQIIKDLAGSVKANNDETVTHCVTTAEWCSEFDESLTENPCLLIVKPEWIYECSEKRNLMDARKYKPAKKNVVDE